MRKGGHDCVLWHNCLRKFGMRTYTHTHEVEVVHAVTYVSQTLSMACYNRLFLLPFARRRYNCIVPHGQERRHFVLYIFMLPVTFPYFSSALERFLTFSEPAKFHLWIKDPTRIIKIKNIWKYFSLQKELYNINLMISEWVYDNHRRRQKHIKWKENISFFYTFCEEILFRNWLSLLEVFLFLIFAISFMSIFHWPRYNKTSRFCSIFYNFHNFPFPLPLVTISIV